MRGRLIVLCSIASIGLFTGGYLLAQNSKPIPPKYTAQAWMDANDQEARLIRNLVLEGDQTGKSIETIGKDIEAAEPGVHKKTLEAYNDVMAQPDAQREVAIEVWKRYTKEAEHAKSAVQASQSSGEMALRLQTLQVAQNARIIQLLQKIADKK